VERAYGRPALPANTVCTPKLAHRARDETSSHAANEEQGATSRSSAARDRRPLVLPAHRVSFHHASLLPDKVVDSGWPVVPRRRAPQLSVTDRPCYSNDPGSIVSRSSYAHAWIGSTDIPYVSFRSRLPVTF
jgi:hypothetical protein